MPHAHSNITFTVFHNQLLSLPQEIGHLSNLVMLQASNNKLTNLPSSLLQLKKLTEVTCALVCTRCN